MFKGINDVRYFAKGKRSVVYIGEYKRKKVAIKVSKKAKIEARWLKKLNRVDIGPKLLFFNKDYLVYEFIEGIRILDYFKRYKKKKWVVKEVLRQCRILDKLKINKLEMHLPVKHILIKDREAKLIDFERCKKAIKPKNVTQFCQFLMNRTRIDRRRLKVLLKTYKNNQSEKDFKEILRLF